MLFCSSVEVEGSVIPAGAFSENAAWEGAKRLLIRSTSVTIPAANNPEIRAINKTWRVESLYIKLLPSFNGLFCSGGSMALGCLSTGYSLCHLSVELGQSDTTLKPDPF